MIDQYVKEIRSCLENENYLIALQSSLLLPDICGYAEHPNWDSGKRYIDWCKRFLLVCNNNECKDSDSIYIPAEYIYRTRCHIIHSIYTGADKKDMKTQILIC